MCMMYFCTVLLLDPSLLQPLSFHFSHPVSSTDDATWTEGYSTNCRSVMLFADVVAYHDI